METYRVCNRCVMDTTDPEIRFDGNGICNHCREYDRRVKNSVFSGEEGRKRLSGIVEAIKQEGKNKQYDCVIGVSGGVDSTYVAVKVKEFGLRPLAVHLDNGWDSELAVKNIENIVTKLKIDLYTYIIDWQEFRDIQLSFLKASTPDSEIPSDHAIFSLMYNMVKKTGVRYLICGINERTESHLPSAWSQGHFDWRYIKGVHTQFGRVKLRTFPHNGLWALRQCSHNVKQINILNYLGYVKKDAMRILERDFGWRYYGWKHHESIYTRFYQGYILPKKFGYDKRKVHLSSLICSGEMSRSEALEELKKEPYPAEAQQEDKRYVIKKLGLTHDEFEKIMALPKRTYWEYPSNAKYRETLCYKIEDIIYRIYYRMCKILNEP